MTEVTGVGRLRNVVEERDPTSYWVGAVTGREGGSMTAGASGARRSRRPASTDGPRAGHVGAVRYGAERVASRQHGTSRPAAAVCSSDQ